MHTNLRVHLTGDSQASAYSVLLLSIRNEAYKVSEPLCKTSLPSNRRTTDVENNLIQSIFKDMPINHANSVWLLDRAILAPLNETLTSLNNEIINMIAGQAITCKSFDSTVSVEEAVHFPVQLKNFLNIPGISPHKLTLKIGSQFIVLRF